MFLVLAEKGMVMDMIKAAMSSKDDYYKRDYNPEFMTEDRTILPPIGEGQKPAQGAGDADFQNTYDRLVLQEQVPPLMPGEPNNDVLFKPPRDIVAEVMGRQILKCI